MSGVMPRGQITVMYTDDELYRRFRGGDTSAYDELMIRLGDSLILYLNGYLHNWHDSEDLMIEAFARIMVKKPKIKEGAFKAYLYKTARNLALRFLSGGRLRTFSLDELPEELVSAELTDSDVEKTHIKNTLHNCLGRIEPELREALWLVYFEDMSYAEAAGVMKVGAKRLDHLLQRGKRRLKDELEKS